MTPMFKCVMFLVTNLRCQEAEKTGSKLRGVVRWPERRPVPNNFPEWNYFRFSSTSPRIKTWLRALESVRKILKPLKLDKIKVVAGLVFSALSAPGLRGRQALFSCCSCSLQPHDNSRLHSLLEVSRTGRHWGGLRQHEGRIQRIRSVSILSVQA